MMGRRFLHSLSHDRLLSANQGQLLPIGLVEVLPGDTFQHATSALVRLAPLQTPVMTPVHVSIHHWYVPFRLIWENWEDFITGGPDGEDASVFPTKTVASPGVTKSSLLNYLGAPVGCELAMSALPMRAYQLIWREWYRDQDLQAAPVISLADGNDTTTSDGLQNVCWRKDRYTVARPWEQKGPEVSLPLGTSAPITGSGNFSVPGQDTELRSNVGGAGSVHDVNTDGAGALDSNLPNVGVKPWKPAQSIPFANIAAGLEADLSDATAATINSLREAFAVQKYEEARARYGSRYTEYLRYLGVRSSDARLQRPEYLGGGKQTIQFSEVLQTANDEGSGVGNLYGHGIGALRSNRYRRFFEEHGFVISLMSVQPITIYFQGLQPLWNRRTKFDFWQKEFQHIGQAEIPYKELYVAHATPDGIFGYIDRYDEYRRLESSVHGEFTDVLKDWHMAREFSADPALNASFVSSNPTNRVYQDQASDQLYIMVHHSLQARRLVAPVGTPLGV